MAGTILSDEDTELPECVDMRADPAFHRPFRVRRASDQPIAGPNGQGRQDAAGEALVRLLLQEHGKALMAFAYRLTRDHAAAEDIVQETLVRAWQHPDVLANGKGSVRGWLFMVVRNLVRDKVRARALRPREVPELETEMEVAHDHARHVVDSVIVGDALHRLSGEHRAVLEQLYFAGNTGTEAARALGIPVGTVKSRSYHALRALRTLLQAPNSIYLRD